MSQRTKTPDEYGRCLATEGSCPLRDTCLRSKVHREATEQQNTAQFITVVNLHNRSLHPCSEACRQYRSDKPQRFAKGMTHIFDSVPKGIYKSVQTSVEQCFSSRRVYFYCKKGEMLISPSEQEAIARIFRRHGLQEPPQFDGYEECYDWS